MEITLLARAVASPEPFMRMAMAHRLRVICLINDLAAMTDLFSKYARSTPGHALPLTLVTSRRSSRPAMRAEPDHPPSEAGAI